MSVNKDVFLPRRDFNYDFQSVGQPEGGWPSSDRVPEALVPTHCSFCGVQRGMYLRVAEGKVIGVEARDYAHNRGKLCPKGVEAMAAVLNAPPLPEQHAKKVAAKVRREERKRQRQQ